MPSSSSFSSLNALGSGAFSSHPIRSRHATEGCRGANLAVPKTYTILLPKTRLSWRVFYNKSGAECFFDPCNLSLWTRQVMTDDKRQVQPINAEWRSVQGTLTGSGRVDHVQFRFNLKLSTRPRGTLFNRENVKKVANELFAAKSLLFLFLATPPQKKNPSNSKSSAGGLSCSLML